MKRIVSCSTLLWPSDTEPLWEVIRNCGIECVELTLPNPDRLPKDCPGGLEGLVTSAAELLSRHGLRVTSSNVCSGDPKEPQVLELARHKIRLAQRLGATIAVAEAGWAGSEDERRRILDHLRELGDEARRHGMTLALDTRPGLMQDWRSMVRTINDLDHPNVRINFDPGHYVFYNPQAQLDTSLARVCQLVAHVHLKDCVGYGQRSYRGLGAGGAVDFFRVRELLDVCGFTGPYSIDLDLPPGQVLPDAPEFDRELQRSLATLRWCGYFDS